MLEANEDYWDIRYPKVQKVIFDSTFAVRRKEAMKLCMEEQGKVDIVTRIRPLDTLSVAESSFAQVVKSKDVTQLRGIYNQRKKGSKWQDIRLRQALNHAINRKELLQYAAKGNAHNFDSFNIPPGALGHTPNLTPYEYDTDHARALLTEAGYPEGFQITIITHEALKLEVQIVSKMLERIGLRTKVDVYTWQGFLRKIYFPMLDKPPEEQEWDFFIDSVPDVYGHTGATLLTFGFIEQSNFRWIQYDPIYEGMWNQMAKTIDINRQEAIVREMVRYIHDHAYTFYLYSPLTLYAVNKEIDFVPHKEGYLRLKETSVTENHWSVRGKNN